MPTEYADGEDGALLRKRDGKLSDGVWVIEVPPDMGNEWKAGPSDNDYYTRMVGGKAQRVLKPGRKKLFTSGIGTGPWQGPLRVQRICRNQLPGWRVNGTIETRDDGTRWRDAHYTNIIVRWVPYDGQGQGGVT